MNWKISLAILVISAAAYASCNKEASSGNVPVQILLTDAPTALDEVNVDIREVQVKFRDDTTSGGWTTLNTNAGVYNLLALQNGVTNTLATGNIPDGILKEVRFILGPNNTVKVNGQVKPLTIPSGSESGLKIKIDKKLSQTLNTFVLDFDAAQSVKDEGANGYKLRPVIKLK